MAGWKFFYYSSARIVECVSEYTFLISKNNKQTTATTKNKNQKKQKKLKKKENISGKSIKKNKFATTQVKIFLVTRISGSKSFIFFGLTPVTLKKIWKASKSFNLLIFQIKYLLIYQRKTANLSNTFLLIFKQNVANLSNQTFVDSSNESC